MSIVQCYHVHPNTEGGGGTEVQFELGPQLEHDTFTTGFADTESGKTITIKPTMTLFYDFSGEGSGRRRAAAAAAAARVAKYVVCVVQGVRADPSMSVVTVRAHREPAAACLARWRCAQRWGGARRSRSRRRTTAR